MEKSCTRPMELEDDTLCARNKLASLKVDKEMEGDRALSLDIDDVLVVKRRRKPQLAGLGLVEGRQVRLERNWALGIDWSPTSASTKPYDGLKS